MALDFSPARKPLNAFSQAGLTDIVFLLLIFFLLTSNFIPQQGIPVNLPQSDAAARPEPDFLSVAITKEGTFYVNETLVSRDDLLQAVEAAKGDRTALVIRADREATVGQFTEVAGVARALELRVLMATDIRREER